MLTILINTDQIIHLKEIRKCNISRIIIAHININSVRNTFEELKTLMSKISILFFISETKLDASFPANQFFI